MKTLRKKLGIALAFIAPLAAAGAYSTRALGFGDFISWAGTAHGQEAGAGYIYGTGGQADWGITCAMCHVNDKQQQGNLGVTVTPTPAWEMVNGNPGYKPGQTYQIVVAMGATSIGLGVPEDLNNMAVTVENDAGALAGQLITDVCMGGPNTCIGSTNCPASFTPIGQLPKPATTYMFGPTCNTLLSIGRSNPALTSWKFTWKAPAAGSGRATFFYGVVDGNAGGEPISSLGDDVVQGTIKLDEGT